MLSIGLGVWEVGGRGLRVFGCRLEGRLGLRAEGSESFGIGA